MHALKIISVIILLLIFGCNNNNSGISPCALPLKYITNENLSGYNAIRHASEYYASVDIGNDGFLVDTLVDTTSSSLVINQKEITFDVDAQVTNKNFKYKHNNQESYAAIARDIINNVGCISTLDVDYTLTYPKFSTSNILGLAGRSQNAEPLEPFVDQVAKTGGISNVFSLSLCGYDGDSHLNLGGIDIGIRHSIGNYISILDKSSYVVPALRLRLADTKEIIGNFPNYDDREKASEKTYIDSASSFLLFPPKMAENLKNALIKRAEKLGLLNNFPDGYFNIRRSAKVKSVRFRNEIQARQFPYLEVQFAGLDGSIKNLIISPEHYFKSINPKNPLDKIFAIRESPKDAVLGQPFLENYYVMFDRQNGVIGFGDIELACK